LWGENNKTSPIPRWCAARKRARRVPSATDGTMDTSQYTAPPVPTSIDAITITQTLTRLGSPYTITFTTLATVTLSKFLPTPTQDSQTQDQSGLSPSTIGAIVGSILGLIVLLALVYFCCARGGDDEPPEDDPDPYPHPGREKYQDQAQCASSSGEIRLSRVALDESIRHQWIRRECTLASEHTSSMKLMSSD